MKKKLMLLLLSAQAVYGLVPVGRASSQRKEQVSTRAAKSKIIDEIAALFDQLKIKRVVDIGCGDFWIRKALLPNMIYVGVDASDETIDRNRMRFAEKEYLFLCADPLEDVLPCADMLICRRALKDCRKKDAPNVLRAFKASGSMFLFMMMPKNKVRAICALPEPLLEIKGYNNHGKEETWGLWLLQELEV